MKELLNASMDAKKRNMKYPSGISNVEWPFPFTYAGTELLQGWGLDFFAETTEILTNLTLR